MTRIFFSAIFSIAILNGIAQTKSKATSAATKPGVKTVTLSKTTQPKPATPKYKNASDSFCYALAVNIGRSFKAKGLKQFNGALFAQTIEHVLKSDQVDFTEDEMNQIINNYLDQLANEKAALNIESGKKFLAENKKKAGVIETSSGLQYIVLKEGEGVTAKITDKVKCHYHGTLINGEVFDSSVERNEPVEFPVNGVIQGWVEALQLMKKGSKYKLFIPANLAYGNRDMGPNLPADSTLIFEVEILDIIAQ